VRVRGRCFSCLSECLPHSGNSSPSTTPSSTRPSATTFHYEVRLRVLQEFAPKDPDRLAIQYTRYDDLTDYERVTVERLRKKENVIVRECVLNVPGADELSPLQVIKRSRREFLTGFTSDDFQRAWKPLKVHPGDQVAATCAN